MCNARRSTIVRERLCIGQHARDPSSRKLRCTCALLSRGESVCLHIDARARACARTHTDLNAKCLAHEEARPLLLKLVVNLSPHKHLGVADPVVLRRHAQAQTCTTPAVTRPLTCPCILVSCEPLHTRRLNPLPCPCILVSCAPHHCPRTIACEHLSLQCVCVCHVRESGTLVAVFTDMSESAHTAWHAHRGQNLHICLATSLGAPGGGGIRIVNRCITRGV